MDIKNVSFAYRDNIKRLKQIDAHINKGEITTIIGPNGSGKSTLMGVLMNHNKPQEGEVLLQDQSLHTYKAKALAKTLGVVHQHNVAPQRSEEHTSELQSRFDLVCRLLLEKKKLPIFSAV